MRTPDSDEWWVARLIGEMNARRPRIRELGQWIEGTPPLPFPDNDADAYRRIQKVARLNLAELIVSAVVHRMQPLAFRTAADNDENGDVEARRLMKANDFGVMATQVISWMLTYGEAYTMQGSNARGPRVTAEHPATMVAETDPLDRSSVLAAIKIYRDDRGERDVCILRRPGREVEFERPGRSSLIPKPGSGRRMPSAAVWQRATETRLGIETAGVSVFRTPTGAGEFERHLDTLKRINHSIMQRMIIIALQAFRQRGIKGVPNTDEDGKEIDYNDIFTADPGALWILPETAELWESGQADLTPVLAAVKDDIRYLAAVSSTPLYSIFPDDANGSAEGASLQREGLLFKTEEHITWASAPFARAMSDLFALAGDERRADVAEIDVKWMNPKRSSPTERASAGTQARAAGVPWRTRMEKFLELTPDEIAEAEQQRAADAFMEVTDDADGQPAQTRNLPGSLAAA